MDDVDERFRRALERVDHRVLHGAPPHLAVVFLGARLAQGSQRRVSPVGAVGFAVARLVEPRVAGDRLPNHDVEGQRLHHLQQVRVFGIPPRPLPSPQQAQAHFAILVQVGVEAHAPLACRHEFAFWRRSRILGRQPEVKFEAT